MTIEEIKENLCYYDKRNPLYLSEEKKENCYCDNCFYRRDILANELLKYLELK